MRWSPIAANDAAPPAARAFEVTICDLKRTERIDPERAELELDRVERRRADFAVSLVLGNGLPHSRSKHHHFERFPETLPAPAC